MTLKSCWYIRSLNVITKNRFWNIFSAIFTFWALLVPVMEQNQCHRMKLLKSINRHIFPFQKQLEDYLNKLLKMAMYRKYYATVSLGPDRAHVELSLMKQQPEDRYCSCRLRVLSVLMCSSLSQLSAIQAALIKDICNSLSFSFTFLFSFSLFLFNTLQGSI